MFIDVNKSWFSDETVAFILQTEIEMLENMFFTEWKIDSCFYFFNSYNIFMKL